MRMYNAAVEVRSQKNPSLDAIDRFMDNLAAYHPAFEMSPRGWLDARISFPAETLAQACATAIAVVEAALGAPAVACEVMTETEFIAREGWEPVPDLVSVTEAAQLLGVTRQAVLDRINRKTLPAERVGREYVIPRLAVVITD
ncbi:MAG: binding domain protein excisionase family [Aeromicrobium sp.]|nr:binding domain protein excisionase family [Aeromicrobium sp.]